MIETPERKSKLQHLHKCMMRYSDITGEDVAKLKGDIYRDYGVESRSELTDAELDKLILFFTRI